jgi:hypothetical protein
MTKKIIKVKCRTAFYSLNVKDFKKISYIKTRTIPNLPRFEGIKPKGVEMAKGSEEKI